MYKYLRDEASKETIDMKSRKYNLDSDLLPILAESSDNQLLECKKSGRHKFIHEQLQQAKNVKPCKNHGGRYVERIYKDQYMNAFETYCETIDLEYDEYQLKKDLELEKELKSSALDFSLANKGLMMDLSSDLEIEEIPFLVETKTISYDRQFGGSLISEISILKQVQNISLIIEKKQGVINVDDFINLSNIDIRYIFISNCKISHPTVLTLESENVLTSLLFNDMNGYEIQPFDNVLKTSFLMYKYKNMYSIDSHPYSFRCICNYDKISLINKLYSIKLVIGYKSMLPEEYYTPSINHIARVSNYLKHIVVKNKEFKVIYALNTVDLFLSSGLICYIHNNMDELDDLYIENICLQMNSIEMWWEDSEILRERINGLNVCILPFDPQLRSLEDIKSFYNMEIENETLSCINFGRIDVIQIAFEFKGNYNLSVTVVSLSSMI